MSCLGNKSVKSVECFEKYFNIISRCVRFIVYYTHTPISVSKLRLLFSSHCLLERTEGILSCFWRSTIPTPADLICSSAIAFWLQCCFFSVGETPLHLGWGCTAVSSQSRETRLSFDSVHSGFCQRGPMWGSLLTAFSFEFTDNAVYRKNTFSFPTCSFLVSSAPDGEEMPASQPLSQFRGSTMPPVVRAHAFVTLGKCHPAVEACPRVSNSHPFWLKFCSKAVPVVMDSHSAPCLHYLSP